MNDEINAMKFELFNSGEPMFANDNMLNFSGTQILEFALSLIAAAVMSFILSRIYIIYGNSLSNRRNFAKNFVILAATTMFIITIVKTSLALSLGLVGALSIVRFRSAIKEPEELTYLFLNIAIGLGCGAGHTLLTFGAFTMISLFIILNKKLRKQDQDSQYYLVVSDAANSVTISNIIDTVRSAGGDAELKRSDENESRFEAAFNSRFSDVHQIESFKSEMKKLAQNAQITLMDTSRDE